MNRYKHIGVILHPEDFDALLIKAADGIFEYVQLKQLFLAIVSQIQRKKTSDSEVEEARNFTDEFFAKLKGQQKIDLTTDVDKTKKKVKELKSANRLR